MEGFKNAVIGIVGFIGVFVIGLAYLWLSDTVTIVQWFNTGFSWLVRGFYYLVLAMMVVGTIKILFTKWISKIVNDELEKERKKDR